MNATATALQAVPVSTLRPGLLVSLSTNIKGNTYYRTEELEGTHRTETGEARARWETTRTVTDPEEQEAATKVRTKVRTLITSVCASSAFGLLCPEEKAGELAEKIAASRALVDEFNANARLTRVTFNILYGRIAQDDVEAMASISAEVRGLMEAMEAGVAAMDPERIRKAANSLREVSDMLSEEAFSRADVAIEAGRAAARKIVKAVKAGEQAAMEVDRAAIARISMARTSFLDIGSGPTHVAAPVMNGRAIDLDPAVMPSNVRRINTPEIEV